MSIFVFTKANIELFKHKPSFTLPTSPYWLVDGRICYHVHEVPVYVIHNELTLEYMPDVYASYLHLQPNKKPLYAMASYTHAELTDMSIRLELPLGKKSQMYTRIKEEIDKSMTHFKKIDSR